MSHGVQGVESVGAGRVCREQKTRWASASLDAKKVPTERRSGQRAECNCSILLGTPKKRNPPNPRLVLPALCLLSLQGPANANPHCPKGTQTSGDGVEAQKSESTSLSDRVRRKAARKRNPCPTWPGVQGVWCVESSNTLSVKIQVSKCSKCPTV